MSDTGSIGSNESAFNQPWGLGEESDDEAGGNERETLVPPGGPEPRQIRTDGEFLMGRRPGQSGEVQNAFTPGRFWDPTQDTNTMRKRRRLGGLPEHFVESSYAPGI